MSASHSLQGLLYYFQWLPVCQESFKWKTKKTVTQTIPIPIVPFSRGSRMRIRAVTASSEMCVRVQSLNIVWLFATLWTESTRLLCPRDFPGKNTGVGCHFLLQGIFPTQGSNLHLLHCRRVLFWYLTCYWFM